VYGWLCTKGALKSTFWRKPRLASTAREFIRKLRGIVWRYVYVIDIYDNIDNEEFKKRYLEHIPQLGL
jgi:hypothetical protein